MASYMGNGDSAGKINFPGMVGTKRRRMRSGGNVSTISNNVPPKASTESLSSDDDESDEKTTQTSKCKGSSTIPIFLKKTYKMIETCDSNVASWTPDGEMFVVKDPDVFAANIIPQYFDHNKFSSFARQLNFYGFRKMQSKPIRNSDFDAATAKHVTFYNEKFKRGRCDLLKEIQRSTRGGTSHGTSDNSKEVQNLRDQVSGLEKKIEDMNIKVEERFRRLELDMLGRMEQMMLAMQQQQQTQLQLQAAAAAGVVAPAPAGSSEVPSSVTIQQQQWDPLPFPRTSSVTSAAGSFSNAAPQVVSQEVAPPTGAPTLPPHPKQKQLPVQSLPTAMALPPSRLNSLRGISRGISGLSRGASVESSASAVLMRNSWEDKFFSMLMLGENEQAAAQAAILADPIGNATTVSDQQMNANGANFQAPANHNIVVTNDSYANIADTGGPPNFSYFAPGPAFVSDRSMSAGDVVAHRSPGSSVSGTEGDEDNVLNGG